MSLAVPPPEVIRLTAQNPFTERLQNAQGSSEKRSPLCGSRIVVDVNLDDDGRVAEVGMRVNACAFSQASATLLARNLVGRSAEELAQARDAMAGWMAGDGVAPNWPDIHHLDPERLNAVRRQSVQLAFQAAAEAAEQAAAKVPAKQPG
ncbi:NifU homolog involved in Fe-S cluster formation [Sphingomonas gellani]|uniref:NifU homolog involved in Fe-S cluster formation n=1 Tax=Sphingomonas gellani TaxID=1166340 RepID=A0A1H7ZJK5_9SPHN|nr:iron-sulfur cluster assembly scaffold protein [Sphingomonas gellani]SEM58505.1 NifU homolog involved in Fe-S cluster formation [Sphingomonas gellani]